MSKHIGIVGCSAEGAALCYRTICLEGKEYLGEHAHPEITMHTFPLAEYMRFIQTGDWRGVADLMLASEAKLAAAGADFMISPDNTIHEAFGLVLEKAKRPWLHIAEAVAEEADRLHFRQLAVLGTRYLMEGPVYPAKLNGKGIGCLIPDREDREKINTMIFSELVYGIITPESTACFASIIEKMKELGCDAVVLGCTEIPLIVTPQNSPLPVLDSTRLLARAALRRAVED
ncbi:MAG: amino acid racemase [Candidatus Omnitrophota bacterium]